MAHESELAAKIEILERENEILSEQAESIALLGILSETINTRTDQQSLITDVLEQIATLTSLTECFCLSRSGGETVVLASYSRTRMNDAAGAHISIPDDVLQALRDGPLLQSGGVGPNGERCSIVGIPETPHSVCLFPFCTRTLPHGIFVFVDCARQEQELMALFPLLSRVTDMVVAKLDNFAMIGELESINAHLDDLVATKSRGLSEANKALGESEEKFRLMAEQIVDVLFTTDTQGIVTYLSPSCRRVFGWEPSEMQGRTFSAFIAPDDRAAASRSVETVIAAGRAITNLVLTMLRSDGSMFWGEVSASLIMKEGVGAVGTLGLIRDVTERKHAEAERLELERRLFHSQKLESIGVLAGGIAHDFNNLLGVVLGYLPLLEKRREDEKAFRTSLAVVTQAAERGADLVQKILAFARKGDTVMNPVDVPDVVDEMLILVGQTFPRDIIITPVFEPGLPKINADRTQLYQVLLNLCLNAKDALPHGGRISIEAHVGAGADVRAKHPSAKNDSYVLLSVSDTGAGMTDLVKAQVFDPFFTTKDKGKGTGLGLSVAYGIIQNHHGYIDIASTLGTGTAFTVYLPIAPGRLADTVPAAREAVPAGSPHETILVVEDESGLNDLVCETLQQHGYAVVTAFDGDEAIRAFAEGSEGIDLILCDLGLPKISGPDLFQKFKDIDPDVKVFFASGFFDPEVRSRLEAGAASGFIQKPYRMNQLLAELSAVLDRR